MSILDEINKDLEEMGIPGGDTIEESMDKLGNEVVKAAKGGGLPEVTAEDAGKILTVDSNGNWVATTASPSGNLDVMICNFTDIGDGYLSCDKTVQEIIEAYNSGKTVIGRYLYDGDTYKQYMLSYVSPEWQGESYDHKIQFISAHITDDGPNTQPELHADVIGYRVADEGWTEGWYNPVSVVVGSHI